MEWLKAAWGDVKVSAITNAFLNCGIGQIQQEVEQKTELDNTQEEAIQLGLLLGLEEVELYESTVEHDPGSPDWESRILCPE